MFTLVLALERLRFTYNGLNFNLFGTGIPTGPAGYAELTIPITFGEVYTFAITGRAFCSAFDFLD